MLEARQGVDGDEAEDRAVVLGDDRPGSAATRTARGASTMSLGPAGIALVGEERGDRVGVVGRGRAKGDGGAVGGVVGHAVMVPGRTIDAGTVQRPSRRLAARAAAPARTARPPRSEAPATRPGPATQPPGHDRTLAEPGERRGEPALGRRLEEHRAATSPAASRRDRQRAPRSASSGASTNGAGRSPSAGRARARRVELDRRPADRDDRASRRGTRAGASGRAPRTAAIAVRGRRGRHPTSSRSGAGSPSDLEPGAP